MNIDAGQIFWTFNEVIKYAAFTVWTTYSINVVLGLIGRIFYKPKTGLMRTDKVELVLVSIASIKVRRALLETINSTLSRFPDIPLNLLVDEGAELLEELHILSQGTEQIISPGNKLSFRSQVMTKQLAFTIVVVPKNYRPDLIAKGRAMNYFIENKVRPEKWYTFIDDDNVILDDKFLYELPYYEREGYVACNPVLYTRQGKSVLTTIMDWIRFFEDITVFRFFTGLTKRPWIGLHGEMLTVRGDVLKDIGYGEPSISEDFRFATHLIRRNLKVWQSDTRVSLRPPNDIHDLCKQRARWFKGIWSDIKYCPPKMRMIMGYRLISWTCGIIGSWIFAPLWIFWTAPHPAVLMEIAIGGFFIWIIFIYSIVNTRQPLYYIMLIPLFGIFESISFWSKYDTKKFVVIDKN
ncbi:MAG TPA: glycosyltransferase family 2 protein [Nitrososphaeraceae archaeon]|jgi:beta-1,4-mannosyltransferase|nr:glycosyltransferase family 2 protein [Nitrososphaeraceae archaeon]